MRHADMPSNGPFWGDNTPVYPNCKGEKEHLDSTCDCCMAYTNYRCNAKKLLKEEAEK